ncbi:hypothetical protein K474DRAFT_1709427 [Panus rudis PR-1116 ss-1]|nr:hypothetical protein K474DRAFT_1709427 [Panus rudis PR-1116 ss-1]
MPPVKTTTLGARVTYRPQHTSSTSSTASATIADPDRPDLFYHLFEPPHALSPSAPVYALSLLEEAPIDVTSRTIIGWLPAVTAGEGEDSAGLNDFVPNAAFVEILHEAVKSGLTDGVDEIQKNGALQLQQGWMHIHDERNPPPLGRIGDSDDILGTVLVENGEIKAETYQPMPSYRLCTADGIVRLTEGLAQRLKETLEREARAGHS